MFFAFSNSTVIVLIFISVVKHINIIKNFNIIKEIFYDDVISGMRYCNFTSFVENKGD